MPDSPHIPGAAVRVDFMASCETIIGLEVHVQLLTRTKLFCRCSAQFGGEPNTQTCPVCAGLPGALPVLNREAMRLATVAAVALNCEIPHSTKWDRKQYYYPDLPKGYQISQFDLPMSRNGYLEISGARGALDPKRVRILRAHLEEDAGKSMHDELEGKADSRIDLNRTGTPLLEIVTEPDMRSPAEAHAFLTELKLLLNYLNVSDCNMQEGSLRVDANVNLHILAADETIATPIVEIKNLNSFRAAVRAIEYEASRQYEAWKQSGERLGDVPKQTRGWDEATQTTRLQRGKEESSDYRYFPDPDLVPVVTDDAQIEAVRRTLGELPAMLRTRLESSYGITAYDADVLVNQGRPLVDYYIALADACGDGKTAANWMQQDVLRKLGEDAATIDRYPVPAAALGALLVKVGSGEINTHRAREVLAAMVDTGETVDEAMDRLGIRKVDASELVELCRELLAANPRIVADIKSGKTKAAGALIGQAKQKNPNVDPAQIREICLKLAVEFL